MCFLFSLFPATMLTVLGLCRTLLFRTELRSREYLTISKSCFLFSVQLGGNEEMKKSRLESSLLEMNRFIFLSISVPHFMTFMTERNFTWNPSKSLPDLI